MKANLNTFRGDLYIRYVESTWMNPNWNQIRENTTWSLSLDGLAAAGVFYTIESGVADEDCD